MNYPESIAWLEGVTLYTRHDGLDSMRALCAYLGQPQKRLRFVHVAGTNGKGTICALLAAMLAADGKHVGLFTSPHLVSYRERIQTIRPDGENALCPTKISEDAFAAAMTRVREASERVTADGRMQPTYFQMLTAAAFLAFAEAQCDVVVLEVGVGGRIDATNVIDNARLCVIASISLDHTAVLGDTVEKIAAQKGGIMKPDVTTVIGPNVSSVIDVLERQAAALGAHVVRAADTALALTEGPNGCWIAAGVQTHLRGGYQTENIRTAVCAARQLGLGPAAIAEGLNHARWPGRMQLIEAADHAPLLLEGAHNEGGAQALCEWLTDHRRSYTQVTLVYGALTRKDPQIALARLLAAPIDRIIFAPLQAYGTLTAEAFREMTRSSDLPVDCEPDMKTAVAKALSETDKSGLVCAAGSLYLVGEILQLIENEG